MIDLDASRASRAAKREGAQENIVVRFSAEEFSLPVELPAAVLEVLLDGDLDLADLVRTAASVWQDTSAEEQRREEAGALVMEALLTHPALPVDVARAIRDAVAALFGAEQWQRFNALNPSLVDVIALIKGLVSEYGVGLGEAVKSPPSSATDGVTSKPTFNAGTASTPAGSGLALATLST